MENVNVSDLSFFKSAELSDVVVQTAAGDLKLHKIILSRAPFFRKALSFNGANNHGITSIDLREDDPAMVKIMVKWIYTSPHEYALLDTLPRSWSPSPDDLSQRLETLLFVRQHESLPVPPSTAPSFFGEEWNATEHQDFIQNLEDLRTLADKYSVTSLVKLCDNKITEMISNKLKLPRHSNQPSNCRLVASDEMMYYFERIFTRSAPEYLKDLRYKAAVCIIYHTSCLRNSPGLDKLMNNEKLKIKYELYRVFVSTTEGEGPWDPHNEQRPVSGSPVERLTQEEIRQRIVSRGWRTCMIGLTGHEIPHG